MKIACMSIAAAMAIGYALQFALVIVNLVVTTGCKDDYTSKKEFFLDLIPFYPVYRKVMDLE